MNKDELKKQFGLLRDKTERVRSQEAIKECFDEHMRLISYLPEKDYNYLKSPVNISQRLMKNKKYDGDGLFSEIKQVIRMMDTMVFPSSIS